MTLNCNWPVWGLDSDGKLTMCCNDCPDTTELFVCHKVLFCGIEDPGPFTKRLSSKQDDGTFSKPVISAYTRRNQCIWRTPSSVSPCDWVGNNQVPWNDYPVQIKVVTATEDVDADTVTYDVEIRVGCSSVNDGLVDNVSLTFSKNSPPSCQQVIVAFPDPAMPGVEGELILSFGNTVNVCTDCHTCCGCEPSIDFSFSYTAWQDYAIAGSVQAKGWRSNSITGPHTIPASLPNANNTNLAKYPFNIDLTRWNPAWGRSSTGTEPTRNYQFEFTCNQSMVQKTDDPDDVTPCDGGGYMYSSPFHIDGVKINYTDWWPYIGYSTAPSGNDPNYNPNARLKVHQAKVKNDLYINGPISIIGKTGTTQNRRIWSETPNYECGNDIYNLGCYSCAESDEKYPGAIFNVVYDGGLTYRGMITFKNSNTSAEIIAGSYNNAVGSENYPYDTFDAGQPPFPGLSSRSLPYNALVADPAWSNEPLPLHVSITMVWWCGPPGNEWSDGSIIFTHYGTMAAGIKDHPDNPQNIEVIQLGNEILFFGPWIDNRNIDCTKPGSYPLQTSIPEQISYHGGGTVRTNTILNATLTIEPF